MDKRRIYDQIRNLLKRRHEPLVEVGNSVITGAGNGVFSRHCIDIDQTNDTTSTTTPTVMCLYPGIYTPDIPPSSYYHHDERTTIHYLANQIPPSFQHGNGPDMNSNAYILNLQRCGGYIDGWSIQSQYCNDNNNREESSRRLDINPSACGHLINHDAYDCNTSVFSFSWREVLEQQPQEECNDDEDDDQDDYFALPNEMRSDGSPWYYDEIDDDITYFPTINDKSQQPSITTYTTNQQQQLCGAALILTSPVSKGDELLLDYCLQEPLPKWAKDWYHVTTTASCDVMKNGR